MRVAFCSSEINFLFSETEISSNTTKKDHRAEVVAYMEESYITLQILLCERPIWVICYSLGMVVQIPN